MKEFIDKLANNDYVLMGLIILLVVLVILFFIVLLFTGKGKKKKDVVKENVAPITNDAPQNIDFNHDEFVKETTAEFELTPLSEIEPQTNEFVPDKIEESPAYKFDAPDVEKEPVQFNNFSFDELSKMISDELSQVETMTPQEDMTVPEIEKTQIDIPTVTFVDSFKQVEEEIKPVEVSSLDQFDKPSENKTNDNFSSVFINKEMPKHETKTEVVLPKLATDINAIRQEFKQNSNGIYNPFAANTEKTNVNEEANKVSEPVIKEEETPLFARFNAETYDINKKD